VKALPFGVIPHPVEQDGFANSPESDHQDAFGRQAATNALEGDTNPFPQFVAARQFRRLGACARGKGIRYRIHGVEL
jgi:hypothetical protein